MSTNAFDNAPRRVDVALVFAGTALVALTLVPWYGLARGYDGGLWVTFAAFVAWNSLSITAGYHRLWSHRTYSAKFPVRLIFALGGALALQNSIREWCSNHRNHHRNVDDPGADPYAATRGLWFSHLGWMLRDYPSASTDFDNIRDLDREDPLVTWQHRHYWTLALLMNVALPLGIGALLGDAVGGLLLLGFLRLVVCHHTTFFINSLAHYVGSQPYSDANSSRDNPLIALLTFGEGYHNFHHTFEWDYRNGIRWYHFDPTKWLITLLSWMNLARDLKHASPDKIEKRRAQMQLKRTSERIRSFGPDTGVWLARLEKEYEQLVNVLNEWARCRQQWLEGKKARILQRWEKTELHARLREVEQNLERQRRRWRVLTTQFARATG